MGLLDWLTKQFIQEEQNKCLLLSFKLSVFRVRCWCLVTFSSVQKDIVPTPYLGVLFLSPFLFLLKDHSEFIRQHLRVSIPIALIILFDPPIVPSLDNRRSFCWPLGQQGSIWHIWDLMETLVSNLPRYLSSCCTIAAPDQESYEVLVPFSGDRYLNSTNWL